VEEELAVLVPTIDEFKRPLETEPDGFFRHYNDLFGKQEDQFNSFRAYFWKGKDLLLWYQRAYLPMWFKDYDPMRNDASDTPYDYDHILPKSHLINSGQSNNVYETNTDLKNKFHWNRGLYINSIGNYRIWPFWSNRSDGDSCQSKKLRLGVADLSQDPVAKELHLITIEDFVKASAICTKDKNLWQTAAGYPGDWPESRRKAFQNAVENRVVKLYEELYNEVLSD
jgi:hypothetical protein